MKESQSGISLSLDKDVVWSCDNQAYFSGNVFYEGELYNQQEALNIFKSISSFQDFKYALERANGFFTVIIETKNDFYIGSSHILTIPIFYSEVGGGYISDNYYSIVSQIAKKTCPESKAAELLYSGAIFNGCTLHPDIFQLTGGKVIHFSKDHNKVISSSTYYPSPSTTNKKNDDFSDQADDRLSKVLDSVFSRVKQVAESKPIILLLSGGYDSRLVALQLFKNDIDNVYAVTGNWSDSHDTLLAQEISQRLGFEWIEIKQTSEDLRAIYNSSRWEKFENRVGGHGTKHPQPTTLSAIESIKRYTDIPDEGVILSGNTPADGVEIPELAIGSEYIPKKILANEILNKYYKYGRESYDIKQILHDQVLDRLPSEPELSTNQVIDTLFVWYLMKKDTNSPVNLMYKYYGYDTWSPFLDREFLQFYWAIPPGLQYERRLIEDYTDRLNAEILNGLQIGKAPTRLNIMKKAIINTPFERPARLIKQLLTSWKKSKPTKKEVYKNNYRYGYITFDRFEREFTGEEHERYFLCKDALERSPLKNENDALLTSQN